MKRKNKDILILAGGIIALFFLITAYFLTSSRTSASKTKVITDKSEYEKGNTLKIKIKNGLETDICFSSRYPYYIEKKNGTWRSYQYEDCPQKDEAEKCLNPNQTKVFETNVPFIEKEIYRFAIPACIGCNLGEKFRIDKWFYSNEFTFK